MNASGIVVAAPATAGFASRHAPKRSSDRKTLRVIQLLPVPVRNTAGYRLCGDRHLKRLTFIRRARALGFSIDEVRKLLKLADERKRPCAEVRARSCLASRGRPGEAR